MNLLKFIESFTDDALYTNPTASRRESFAQFGKIGKGLALASIPFGLSALSNKVFAADITNTPSTPIGALQLALTLEYLENEFYATALDTAGLIPVADQPTFMQISQHEASHVSFLSTALGNQAPAMPTFDFTGGQGTGTPLFDPFTNYQTFLALAQAFEDTGVRAYKGQAANLLGSDFLTPALQIHSVEARHASQVRRLRGQKGWITGNDSGGLPSQAQAVYDGEQNTNQAGYDTTAEYGADAGTQAFDEPIDTTTAVTIANLFIV
jgi:hypothetical protein